jgi:hypothetical protein
MKPTKITETSIQELSLIFADHKGESWAPRNPDALVLSTKATSAPGLVHDPLNMRGPGLNPGIPAVPGYDSNLPFGTGPIKQTPARKSSFLDKLASTIKGFYVKEGVPDNIDGDGDGAADYEQILCLIRDMGNDLSSACWMNDPEMRSAAIVAGIDSFIERFDDLRTGKEDLLTGKAGARHSKADYEQLGYMAVHIDAAKKAHAKLPATYGATEKASADMVAASYAEGLNILGASIAAIQDSHGKLIAGVGDAGYSGGAPSEADAAVVGGKDVTSSADDIDGAEKAAIFAKADVAEDGFPENIFYNGTHLSYESYKTKAKDKKPYGDVAYADEKNGKYPIDTEEHVRAAASYFGMPKNKKKYSADEQTSIAAKISAAEKKFGIGEKAAPAVDTAALSEAILSEVRGIFGTVKADILKAVDDKVAEAGAVTATIKAAADAASAETSTLKASIAAMVGEARKPTAKGGLGVMQTEGTDLSQSPMLERVKNEMPAIGAHTPFGGAIKALLDAQPLG